jgi:hypothetical protein
VPKLYKKELIKSRYTCGLVLCGSHCIWRLVDILIKDL